MRLVAILDILIFLAITFVGNHFLLGLPSFLIVWLALISYRLITHLPIQKLEVLTQAYFFILLMPFMVKGVINSDEYYFAFLQLVLYVNIFPVLSRLLKNKKSCSALAVITCILAFLSLVFIGGSRESLIFGPNVMYRILGVLFFLMYCSLSIQKSPKYYLLLLSYVATLIGLVLTGSRGATVVFLLQTLFLLIYFRNFNFAKYVVLIGFVALFFVIFSYWDVVSGILGRVIYFDMNNGSESVRANMYLIVLDVFEAESSTTLLFGLGNESNYFQGIYPHNLFIEILLYHGIVFFLATLILGGLLFLKSRGNNFIGFCFLVFLPIIFGTMLSGNLTDNYPVLSLLLISFFIKDKKFKHTA